MDKNCEPDHVPIDGIPVVPCEYNESLPQVDATIITPIYYLDQITDELKELGIHTGEIISLGKICE